MIKFREMSLRSPTLVQVAEEAGVSRMTVSRILRNVGYFAPETRKRVLLAAEKLSYRPNPMVSAFMTYVRSGASTSRAGVLAYLTSDPPELKWRAHSTYIRFHNGANERAERLGYKLETFQINQKHVSLARLSGILYARGICGVIVAPMGGAHSHLKMDWQKFSASAIGYSLLKPSLPRASNNQYDSMLIALRELYRMGYRRIGFAMRRDDDERVHYNWSAGYLSFFQRRNLGPPVPLYTPVSFSEKETLAWVAGYKPDAIVTTNERLYRWLTHGGYRLPQDIGLVNLDWSPTRAPCAGIDQRSELVGAAAVDMVVEQINHNKFGLLPEPRMVLTSGIWVPGETVRKKV